MFQYCDPVVSASIWHATSHPPTSPRKSANTVNKGSTIAVASRRGLISFNTGSVPSARIASICSVTFIDPSSLAIPDEFRPATISAVNTGPISRTSVIATIMPTWLVAPYVCKARDICNAITAPLKKPVRITTGRLPTPIRSICRNKSSQ